MYLSRKKNKPLLILLFVSIFAILGVAPYFLGPGLTQAEPISNYLNNAFPETISTVDALYEPAFPNLTFDSPLTFSEVANNRIILGQRDGKIFWFNKDPNVLEKTIILDLTDQVGVVWDGGFLGLAIHPQFGTPGKNFIYTWYSSKDINGNDYPDFPGPQSCYTSSDNGNFMYLSRFELNPGDLSYVDNSQTTMIKVDMYGTTHRGGGMDFGNDGFLYLSTGDQARWSQSQDIINNLHGGVLRIDVDKDPTKSHPPIRKMPDDIGNADEATGLEYWIPNDNPFLSPNGDRFEEYYTLGNRNPHRMTKDKETGIFYIGEIGGNQHEEINVVMAGKNYGWPKFEGYGAGPESCSEVEIYQNMAHETPLVEFPRAEANSIIGGYVYRGSEVPELYGKYICADYGIGEEIWSVNISDGSYEQLGVFGSTDIISFGEDAQGELYILKYGESTLFKLQSTNNVNLENVPQFLSQTGAFQNLSTLQPSQGVIPYDLVESFWSDGALKKRWLAIPNDGTHNTIAEQIIYSENDVWQFPVGSVLIKHFELPINENNPNETRRLETRFSIKGSNGNFYFLTYKWNAEQTDAELLEAGLEEDVQITTADGSVENQTWSYPSMGDCFSCHNNASGGTLGTRTRYLNKDFTYDQTGLTANQLVTFSHLGILNETITDADTPDLLTHKAINDSNASLDERARSYLDLNCAYCHRPDTGNRGDFDLRSSLNIYQTGLYAAIANESLGIPDESILSPGDASKSILYLRANSTNPSIAMPPIGKNKIDESGIDLIQEWINQLDPNYEDPTIYPSTYTITNVGNGLVMGIEGSSQANFADVIQMTNNLNDNQQFIVEVDNENYYSLKSVHSDKYVDVQGQGQAEGTNLIQYQGNGTVAQFFSLEYLGNNEYAIKSKSNGLYIGVEGNSNNNGASLKTYSNDGSDFFKWTFTDLLHEPVTYMYDGEWSPSNPNYAVTYIEDSIIVNTGEAVISRNTKCDDLIVNPGASVMVNTDITLTTNITTLKSTSQLYSSLIADGTVEGTVKYERYVNANSGGNDLISPPLSGQTWADFLLSDTNANNILNDGNDSPRTYLFGPFDKATDWFVNYTDEVTTTLNSGTGYRAATNSGTTLTFTGATLTTPVTVDIVNSGTNYADWNLIGNPYPSYISIIDFLSYEIAPNVKNIDILEDISGIYGYDGDASNGWDVITLANAGNRLMAPGQGFFVSADVTHIDDYDIIFDTSMRVTGSDDDFIAGRNTNQLTFLKLNASTVNNNYTTEFYFNDNASQGLDAGFDGKILGNTAPDFAIYSHLVQDNTGLPIALQALNPSDLTNTIIPLGVNANQGEQITFSISETTLPSDVEVYLEDNVANTITLLNSGDYILSPNAGLNGTGRFYLRVTSSVLFVGSNELDALQIYTSTKPKLLNIKGELNDATMLNLYDIQGRLVLNKALNQSSLLNTVDVSMIGNGIYFVKVFSDSNSKTQKLIIK